MFKDFIHRDWLFTDNASDGEITLFLSTHNKIIVKPTNQAQEIGVHVYHGESIADLRNGHVLLEEFINQHHAIADLNGSSVNTIRVYTLSMSEKAGSAYLRSYAHSFSFHNLLSGGGYLHCS